MAKGEIKALYFSDGTTAVAPYDMGSAFAGEKNYMYKGSSNATGWTASGAGVTVATSTDSTAVPRPNTTGSGIQITGVSGSTAYAYYRFIIDPADYSKKLKLAFDMAPVSGYASNDFKVDVYSFTASDYSTGSTRLALSTDSSAVTALPNLTGTFKTTFDAPTATSKWVEVRIGLNGTNTHSVIFSDFICGPGLVTQGAAVSNWASYTLSITSSGSAPAKGTVSVDSAIYRKVGDCLEIKYTYRQTVAGTAGTGQYRFSLPSGFTVNNTVTPGSGNVPHVVGAAVVSSGAANADLVGIVSTPANTANGTYLEIFVGDETTNVSYVGAGVADLGNTNTNYSFSAMVPVNELSGSSAVNVVQNDVEFAYNSGTWDATDTTSFAYGPTGQTMSGALTGNRDKTVQFQTPILATDRLILEVCGTSAGINGWVSVADFGFHWEKQNATEYGAYVYCSAANQAIAHFAQYSYSNGATYGAAGAAWSNSYRWRVRKIAGGQAVGFSEVQPGIASGLVSANGLKGRTDGSTVAAGYVGEKISATLSDYTLTTSEADVTGASLTLTAGVWRIFYAVSMDVVTGATAGNITYGQTLITDSANTYIGTSKRGIYNKTVAAVAGDLVGTVCAEEYVNISASTTYKLRAKRVDSVGTGSGTIYGSATTPFGSQFYAVRIA